MSVRSTVSLFHQINLLRGHEESVSELHKSAACSVCVCKVELWLFSLCSTLHQSGNVLHNVLHRCTACSVCVCKVDLWPFSLCSALHQSGNVLHNVLHRSTACSVCVSFDCLLLVQRHSKVDLWQCSLYVPLFAN